MGDSRGARQSKELDCPYISNLSSDSSAGLVGEKVRCDHHKNTSVAKEVEEFRDSSLKSPAGRMCRELSLLVPSCFSPCFEFSFAFISSFPFFREL